MINIARIPDDYIVITEQNTECRSNAGISVEMRNRHKELVGDCRVRFETEGKKLHVYSPPFCERYQWGYETTKGLSFFYII